MKTILAVELFGILQGLKLSGIPAAEGFNIILLTRNLRGLSEKYNSDRALADEQAKPEGFDDLLLKVYESNEAVSITGKATITPAELETFKRMNQEYNTMVKPVVKTLEEEEIEVSYKRISLDSFSKLIEINVNLNAGQMAVLYDAIVEQKE